MANLDETESGQGDFQKAVGAKENTPHAIRVQRIEELMDEQGLNVDGLVKKSGLQRKQVEDALNPEQFVPPGGHTMSQIAIALEKTKQGEGLEKGDEPDFTYFLR